MILLAAHLVGDILLQNRWLAKHKRDAIWALVLHCAIAALALCVVAGWWDYRAGVAFLAHLAIDGLGLGKTVWPRLLDQGNPDDSLPAPMWLQILDDQALHILSLALIARLA